MSQELTTQTATAPAPLSFGQQIEASKWLADSTLVPDDYHGKPANVLLAIGLGQQIGLSPQRSLVDINVIKGKPTMSAQLIESLVRLAGHKLRITKEQKPDGPSVTCTIIRKDDPDHPYSVTRDKQWAHSMGLDKPGKNGAPSNYTKQPMTMLTWRAITACAREACAEALYGIAYTPDEMHDSDPQPAQKTVARRRSGRLAAVAQAQQQDAPQPDEQPEVVDATAEPMITKQQSTTLNKMILSLGVTSADKAKEIINSYSPRPVEHMNDLTEKEADQVIANIQKEGEQVDKQA